MGAHLADLADEGLTTDGGQPQGFGGPRMPAASAHAQAAEPAPIDVEPQAQVVHARVEARFTISQPEQL